jgi:hypothetical protein
MVDKEVNTIKDLIYYQFAKIVVKDMLNLQDREDARQRHYGFIKSTFRGFIRENKPWSEITGNNEKYFEPEENCSFCGIQHKELHAENLIKCTININQLCKTCNNLKSIQNQIKMCSVCGTARGQLGLYEYFHKIFPGIYFYYDFIPRRLEETYLTLIYSCHECAGTLNKGDINKDGKLDVLDIDFILH